MSQIRLYLDEDATHNRLLQALHNRGVDVISIGDQLRGLLQLIAAKPAEAMENQVEFLGQWIRR